MKGLSLAREDVPAQFALLPAFHFPEIDASPMVYLLRVKQGPLFNLFPLSLVRWNADQQAKAYQYLQQALSGQTGVVLVG